MLEGCLPNDRAVVENIVTVLCDAAPTLSISNAVFERKARSYVITIPLCSEGHVSINALRQAMNYAPARVHDVVLLARPGLAPALRVDIGDEKAPVHSSDIDVIRIQKRTRFE